MTDTLRLKVTRVKDGDTLVAEAQNGDRVDVRVWGVDCPESSQPYGPAAENVARQVVQGEVVDIDVMDSDQYGRLIGRVQKGSTDLARTLAYHGMAWHSRRYPTSERLKELEQEARAENRGLWEQGDPTPPWQYRHRGTEVDTEGCVSSIAAALSGIVGFAGFGTLAAGAPGAGAVMIVVAAALFWAAKQTE